MYWNHAVASAVGTSHEGTNLPCQDYAAALNLPGDVLIGAVCDGAGSAKYADHGSEVAAEMAMTYLKNYPDSFESLSIREIETLFRELVETTQYTLKTLATIKKTPLRNLASTLLIFIATPKRFFAMQIGDGFMVVRLKESDRYKILFDPEHGEYVNETDFVIEEDAAEKMHFASWEGSLEFLCASTDGLENVAIDRKTASPYAPFFKPLDDYARFMPDAETAQKDILEFLESDNLKKHTDDDKTLLLAYANSSEKGEEPCKDESQTLAE